MKHRRWCGECGLHLEFGPKARYEFPGMEAMMLRAVLSCKCRNVPWVGKQKGYRIRRRNRVAA